MKKVVRISLIILGIIILINAVYFSLFFYKKCDDVKCYISNQEACKKVKFVKESDDVVWLYRINGKNLGKCEIDVRILQVKKGEMERKNLEEKSMLCELDIGTRSMPETDISKCSGKLKEEMQNLIIQKLHFYIIENVGEIGEELKSV